MTLVRLTLAALPLAFLVACNTPATQAPNASSTSASNFRLPDAPGCQGDVARFQALIDNDLANGHTTQSVRDAVTADLSKAQAACTAGRSAEATAMVTATRKKFGYPAS
ncbi:hypothetical protein KIH24_08275 [Rhizobiales bacterium TNE-4]|nr:hypothetical protein [Rhizobiales bacterium TNE-4]MBV1827620.1 hypothetical protein [Rhizobiales bacterium TNE-4]